MVKLTPSAAKNGLVRIEKNIEGKALLRASVTVAPEKGKANAALIKLLSQKLGLPKSAFRLIAGEISRLKTILIEGESISLTSQLQARFAALGLDQPVTAEKHS